MICFSHMHQPANQGCCSEPWPQRPSLWPFCLGWEFRQRLRLSQAAGCRGNCWVMAGGNPPDRAAGGLKCQPFPKSLQVDKAEVQENAVSREMGFAFRKGTAAGREEWPRSWAGGWEERSLELCRLAWDLLLWGVFRQATSPAQASVSQVAK